MPGSKATGNPLGATPASVHTDYRRTSLRKDDSPLILGVSATPALLDSPSVAGAGQPLQPGNEAPEATKPSPLIAAVDREGSGQNSAHTETWNQTRNVHVRATSEAKVGSKPQTERSAPQGGIQPSPSLSHSSSAYAAPGLHRVPSEVGQDAAFDRFPVCDVQWDDSGITCTIPAGRGGQFDLSIWREGEKWTGTICEVRWDVEAKKTESESEFQYDQTGQEQARPGTVLVMKVDGGYAYRRRVDGVETLRSRPIYPLRLAMDESGPEVAGVYHFLCSFWLIWVT